jgi:hypothetical protein
MSICIAPVNALEFVASANVLPFHDKESGRFSLRTITIASEVASVDELKYRKLIDLAVKYNARLLALKKRDIQARYQKWCQVSQAQPGSVESGSEVESYWRNKNLYVRRISARSADSAQVMPQLTEIACLFTGGSSLLITINEMEHRARFDVIESRGKTGYCLDGLDYDLALSQVFSLLMQIEGVAKV